MSLWTPDNERNRLQVACRLMRDTVADCIQTDEAKSIYEESLMDLFNTIGETYGWKVCPARSSQLPLVLPE